MADEEEKCTACNGSGKGDDDEMCQDCTGTGMVSTQRHNAEIENTYKRIKDKLLHIEKNKETIAEELKPVKHKDTPPQQATEAKDSMTADDYKNFYITTKCMFETGDMDRLWEAMEDYFDEEPPSSTIPSEPPRTKCVISEKFDDIPNGATGGECSREDCEFGIIWGGDVCPHCSGTGKEPDR